MGIYNRYKDGKKQIKRQNEYNKKNYRRFGLVFHKKKDKELIEELENSSNKADTIRQWHKIAKGG